MPVPLKEQSGALPNQDQRKGLELFVRHFNSVSLALLAAATLADVKTDYKINMPAAQVDVVQEAAGVSLLRPPTRVSLSGQQSREDGRVDPPDLR